MRLAGSPDLEVGVNLALRRARYTATERRGYKRGYPAQTLKLPNEANVFGVLEDLDWLEGQGVRSPSVSFCHMASFGVRGTEKGS